MATTATRPDRSTATQEFLHNLRLLPRTLKEAWFRIGHTPES